MAGLVLVFCRSYGLRWVRGRMKTMRWENVKNSIAKERQAYLQLHACVVLWGFTAILGRLISLPAVQLVH